MIETLIKIHDRFSFELKISFIPEQTAKHLVLEEESEFAINSWLFAPNSLDINRSTYTKEQFYHDTKSNIRLITPIYKLCEICEGENAPIFHVQKALNQLVSNSNNTEFQGNFTYQVKMFSSIVKSAVRDQVIHICKNGTEEPQLALVNKLIVDLSAIKEAYRRLQNQINNIPQTLKESYLFGDEFIGNVIEQYLFLLMQRTKDTTNSKEIQNRLYTFLEEEEVYKKREGYQLLEEGNEANNEAVIIHRGRLKKYIESDLFLHIKKEKDGILAEQFLYAVAAATSMIFATTVSFNAQQHYGNFTTPFLIVLVFSYAFKDRIKELLRIYFDSQLGKKYFDIKRKLAIRNQEIGWTKEAFDFVDESKLPTEVANMRNKSALVKAENEIYGETIMLYRKLVRISRKKIEAYKEYKLAGINDIIRFNLSHFVQKMDNLASPSIYPMPKMDTSPSKEISYTHSISLSAVRGVKPFIIKNID